MDIGRRIESVRRHEGSSTYYLIGARRGRRVQGLSMKHSDKHRYECPPSCGGLLGWRGASEGGRSCSTSGLCMGGRRARRLLSGSATREKGKVVFVVLPVCGTKKRDDGTSLSFELPSIPVDARESLERGVFGPFSPDGRHGV